MGLSLFYRVSLSLTFCATAHAVVQTLPAGVRAPQIRAGVVSGLDETWGSDSRLYKLGDTRSVPFDAATLSRVNDRAQALIRALDVFGSQNLGSQIYLGTLRVKTQPQLDYFAPVFAYGLSDRWTVAVGAPMLRYQNRLSLSSGASNLDYYRQRFSGINEELDAALNINLADEAAKVLAQKGYKPLGNRDQSFMGDMQIALLHSLEPSGSWTFVHQMNFILPTGPADDPDDLMAPNLFHRTAWENTLTGSRVLGARWAVNPFVSLLLPLPDRVQRRVPKDEQDLLPDPETKTSVARRLGPTLTVGGDLEWALDTRWTLRGGTEAAWKSRDSYSGDGRTDLLSENTESFVQRVRAGVGYTTVQAYLNKTAMLPSRVSLDVSDTVGGRNIERQLRTELSAMIFF